MQNEKQIVGRVTYVCDYPKEYTDCEEFIACVRKELPYRPTTGFNFEILTDDPYTRKTIADIVLNYFGEINPRSLEDYMNEPEQGMQMGGY